MDEEGSERQPNIYVVKVPKGKGLDLIYLIQLRKELFKLPIYSAVILDEHPDLIFVEAQDYASVAKAVAYFRYVRAFEEPLSPSEYEGLIGSLQKALERAEEIEEAEELKFEVGQIVKIIRGPFKDRKARIVSVSKNKLFLDLMSGAMLLIEVKPEDVKPITEEEQ
mgnify:CR=1 FL=1